MHNVACTIVIYLYFKIYLDFIYLISANITTVHSHGDLKLQWWILLQSTMKAYSRYVCTSNITDWFEGSLGHWCFFIIRRALNIDFEGGLSGDGSRNVVSRPLPPQSRRKIISTDMYKKIIFKLLKNLNQ